MSFEDRLKQAIQRGQRRGEASAAEAQARALTEEEFKRLHGQYRLALSEHIEACVGKLPGHFPGFRVESVFGERGWGAACYRDDLRLSRGSRSSDYSRLEITVRPYSHLHVLELTGKGTIRNKEAFARQFYEKLEDVDVQRFMELVNAWTLEYAEMFAAQA